MTERLRTIRASTECPVSPQQDLSRALSSDRGTYIHAVRAFGVLLVTREPSSLDFSSVKVRAHRICVSCFEKVGGRWWVQDRPREATRQSESDIE